MLPPTRYTASQAKQQFGEVLSRCVYGGEKIVITKHDRPVAVLIRMEDYRQDGSGRVSAEKPLLPTGEIPENELPPILRDFRQIRKSVAAYQARNGTKDTRSAVEWIRMIRDENDG